MAGAGKTKIGKMLSKDLDMKFVDVDELILKKSRFKSLQEIIDGRGEEDFLKREEEAVMALRETKKTIISTGGSVIYSPKAMKILAKISLIVFLNVDVDSIIKRIGKGEGRGIVRRGKENLRVLFKERFKLYKKYADLEVVVEGDKKIETNYKKILTVIKNSFYNC